MSVFRAALLPVLLMLSLRVGAAEPPRLQVADLLADPRSASGEFELSGVRSPTGGTVSLQLTPFSVWAADARVVVVGADGVEREQPMPQTAFFRGHVQGDPSSRVFLSVEPDGTGTGLVRHALGALHSLVATPTPDGIGLSLRPVDADALAAARPAFRPGQDLLPPVPARGPSGALPPSTPNEAPRAPAPDSAAFRARIAIDSDWEFRQRFASPAAATSYIANLVGFVSTIYVEEVGTQLEVTYSRVFDTSADPYTQNGSTCALYEFGKHWNDNFGGTSRTIAHLMSGKNSGGGSAWLGVLCDGAFEVDATPASCPAGGPTGTASWGGAYGFTSNMTGSFNPDAPTVVWDAVAFAQKVGNNFNSPHTHCYGGLGGNGSPVDACFGQESGPNCSTLPNTLPGPAGQGSGTIMSYCHLLSPGISNISLTLGGVAGNPHPFGVAPLRVPSRMRDHVAARAASFPACLAFPTTTFTIGGTLGGLAPGQSITLRNTSTDENLTRDANGAFTFATPLVSGANYNVIVQTQPIGQTCTVVNGTGTIGAANLTNLTVACDTHVVGGSVSGLGAGAVVVLANANTGENLTVGSNGPWNFMTLQASGTGYDVSVRTHPSGQFCAVSNGVGTINNGNVSNIGVSCSGSSALTALSEGFDALVNNCVPGWICNNRSAPLGTTGWTLATPFLAQSGVSAIGANFDNTTGGNGTISNWLITPVLSFSEGAQLRFWTRTPGASTYPDRLEVRFSIAGDSASTGSSATSVGDFDTLLTTINPFLVSGAGSCPPGAGPYPQTWCEVVLSNAQGIPLSGSGRIAFRYFVTNAGPSGTNSNFVGIDTVSYSATSANRYAVGGNLTGLAAGRSVVLRNATTGEDLILGANGTYAFVTQQVTGAVYNVTVQTQPISQNCTLVNAIGTVGTSSVNDINVTCATTNTNDGILSVSGPTLAPGASGTATVQFGGTPISGAQFRLCVDGTRLSLGGASIPGGLAGLSCAPQTAGNCPAGTSVGISCSGFVPVGSWALPQSVAVTVSAAAGAPAGATPLVFASGAAFSDPGGNSFMPTVTNGSATVAAAWTVGGTISGLAAGRSVVLRNATTGENLTRSANGSYSFATTQASGATYAVSVQTQPVGQICTVTNGSGTIGSASVTNVTVGCVDSAASLVASSPSIARGASGNSTVQLGGAGVARATFRVCVDGSRLTPGTATVPAGLPGLACSVTSTGCPVGTTTGWACSGLAPAGTWALPQTITLPLSAAAGATLGATPLAFAAGAVISDGNGNNLSVGATNGTVTITGTLAVGGTLSGLAAGQSVVLRNTVTSENLSRSANGGFTFATQQANGASYNVIVQTQPAGQSCSVTNGSGTLAGNDVSSIAVTCAAAGHTLSISAPAVAPGGTTTASVVLTGPGVASAQFRICVDADRLTIGTPAVPAGLQGIACTAQTMGNCPAGTSVGISCAGFAPVGAWTLPQTITVPLAVAAGAPLGSVPLSLTGVSYANNASNLLPVTVSGGSLSIISGFTVGGAIAGLVPDRNVVLRNTVTGENLIRGSNGVYTFATAQASGASYNVIVQTQPAGQTCTVANGNGTIGAANVANVDVSCPPPAVFAALPAAGSALDFGTVVQGGSGELTVQLANTVGGGSMPLTLDGCTVSGNAELSRVDGLGFPQTVQPGGSITLRLRLASTATVSTPVTGTLSCTHDAGGGANPVDWPLTGRAVPQQVMATGFEG